MVRIQDVAKRAGVSLTTVSHVINHRDRVSPAMVKRVEEVIEELGYQPNLVAQSLRTGRTNLVALMIPDICNPYYTELARAVQSNLGEMGVDTLIYNTDVPGGHAQDIGLKYLRQIKRKRVDGLIVADAALYDIQAELLAAKMPMVFIGKLPGNETVDSVETDSFDAAYRMGRYLLSKGHTRIAHVTGPSFFPMSKDRREGFEKALADHGHPLEDGLRFEGSFLSPSGQQAVEWLLENHREKMPTAIFLASPQMAIGALAGLADHGFSVPEDIAVATYDTHNQLEFVRPRLTTIGISPSEIAVEAVDLLNERIAGEPAEGVRRIVLDMKMEIHQTA